MSTAVILMRNSSRNRRPFESLRIPCNYPFVFVLSHDFIKPFLSIYLYSTISLSLSRIILQIISRYSPLCFGGVPNRGLAFYNYSPTRSFKSRVGGRKGRGEGVKVR